MKKDDENKDSGPPTIEIDASVTPTEQTPGKGANYGSGSNQITVTKDTNTTAPTKVPDNYVRYKHYSTSTFTIGLVKHNDFPLDLSPTVTDPVTAVYVYYEKDNDTAHEFPLIVCVKVSTTDIKYYQRGNQWTRITDAQLNNKNPETLTGEDLKKLGDELNDVKGKFEVKLEKIKGTYIARPDTSSHEITVEPLCPDSTYTFKGFKHEVPSGSVINRVTIHGQAITEINDTALANKRYVFVYFEKADADEARKKPLLICLSENGDANQNNKWYQRDASNNWTDANSNGDYNTIKPANESGQIDGYTPLGYILKLDYIPKSNSNNISYITGNDPDPSKRVITVEKTVGTGTNNVPEGYTEYTHTPTSISALSNPKFKFNGSEIEALNSAGASINISQPFKVYYEEGDTLHAKPLLAKFQDGSGTNKYYGRGMKGMQMEWRVLAGTDLESNLYKMSIWETGPGKWGDHKINDKGNVITLSEARNEMQEVGSDQAQADENGAVVGELTKQANAAKKASGQSEDATNQNTASTINGQLTNATAKQRLKEAHTQLTTLATAGDETSAKSAANTAVEKLGEAKEQLTASDNDAKAWIDALIDKYKGIGSHMDADKIALRERIGNNTTFYNKHLILPHFYTSSLPHFT